MLFTDESSYTSSLCIGSETVEEWIDLNVNEGMNVLLHITMNRSSENRNLQESIPLGCVPVACKPYVLQWAPPDVTQEGPQVNKFEQGSSVGTIC